MYIVWIIVGALLGGLAGKSLFGAMAGGAIGLLWARQSSLTDALAALRKQVDEVAKSSRATLRSEESSPQRADAYQAPPPPSNEVHAAPAVTAPAATSPPPPRKSPTEEVANANAAAGSSSTPSIPPRAMPSSGPSIVERLWQQVWGWFTAGNVPVKVGILVLFAGVAALLKYAADNGMLHVPVSVRLSGVALAAIAALAFSWRQRTLRRTFALSVQGGAIGILLMTIFAAFRLYRLLPQGAAFALLLMLVAGIAILAVLQDSLALAMLGLVAGFATPIMVSTGQGSHVALFSYYAVLNLAILGVAWKRAWRELNLLGFISTFGIGIAWGVLKYQPELFASTEPFLILNFLFYLIIPWLHVLRAPADRRAIIDGCLMFGNPLISLLAQGALLRWHAQPMAFSALAVAIVYVAFAFTLRKHPAMRLLRDTWAVLAVAFATLAVPLALKANVTGSIFALEGAGLIWLGLRQQRPLALWSGLALQGMAAGALLLGSHAYVHTPLLNGDFIGAMLLVLAAVISCSLFVRIDGERELHRWLALALFVWGVAGWLIAWLREIDRLAIVAHQVAALFALLAVTAWLIAEAARRAPRFELGRAMHYAAPAFLFSLFLPLATSAVTRQQPLAGWMLAALTVSAVAGWRTLRCLRDDTLPAVLAQLAWVWRWLSVAVLAIWIALDNARWLSDSWVLVLSVTPLLLCTVLMLWRPRWMAPPLVSLLPQWRTPLLYSLFAALGCLVVYGLIAEGSAEPVRYVPLLNPLEWMLLTIAVCVAKWSMDADAPAWWARHRPLIAGLALWVFVTSATLRAVHQLGGVAWSSALESSSLAQLSLTVVWSVLGLLAWVWGSRRGQRTVWLAGAIMMGIVLAKLLLIDRTQLGNLFGIGSFMAYGLLCTVIGYLAPAPPKRPLSKEEENHAT